MTFSSICTMLAMFSIWVLGIFYLGFVVNFLYHKILLLISFTIK